MWEHLRVLGARKPFIGEEGNAPPLDEGSNEVRCVRENR